MSESALEVIRGQLHLSDHCLMQRWLGRDLFNFDREFLRLFTDFSSIEPGIAGGPYADIDLAKLYGLSRSDGDGLTETSFAEIFDALSEHRSWPLAVLDYFDSDVRGRPWPVSAGRELELVRIAGILGVAGAGNHRVAAAAAWLSRNGARPILKGVRVSELQFDRALAAEAMSVVGTSRRVYVMPYSGKRATRVLPPESIPPGLAARIWIERADGLYGYNVVRPTAPVGGGVHPLEAPRPLGWLGRPTNRWPSHQLFTGRYKDWLYDVDHPASWPRTAPVPRAELDVVGLMLGLPEVAPSAYTERARESRQGAVELDREHGS